VRYQAVVKQEDWRRVWDTLLKPFNEQQVVYKKHYRTRAAPEILFGVEAKLCEPSQVPAGLGFEAPSYGDQMPCDASARDGFQAMGASDSSHLDESRETSSPKDKPGSSEISDSTTIDDSNKSEEQRPESDEGILLPGASKWLEFWQNTDIPEHNTFVDFAERIGESGFLRRVQSAPALPDADDDATFEKAIKVWEQRSRAEQNKQRDGISKVYTL
jgi:hypothetical protein